MTELDEESRTATAFFDKVIVPLAERGRQEGKSFFSPGRDPEAETYLVEPSRKVMRPEDFELRAVESPEVFIEELSALWVREGDEELAAMAPLLTGLAQELITHHQPEEEDLSPFMYVMF